MTTSVFQQMRSSLQSGFSRATDFLARLSFWRFVGLCILLMIAAGMINSLLPDDKPRQPMVKVEKKLKKLKAAEEAATALVVAEPAAPASPVTTPPASPPTTPPVGAGDTLVNKAPAGKDTETDVTGKPRDIEIKIDDSGIVVKGSADLERLGSKIEKQIEKAEQRQKEADAKAAAGDVDVTVDVGRSGPNLMQFVLLLIIVMFIIRFVANSKLRAEAKAAVAIEAADHAMLKQQLAEARLQALQAQVEPHFLFNTLAAVEHLIETDPPRAAKMQGNLIGYLRSVMPNLRKPDSTVGREVETCRHYLEILKVRMEDRLQVVIDVPTGLESASLPPLMLQSLVENAIQHGLEPKAEGGEIKIKVEIADGHLVVIVADTGIGFSPKSSTSGGGMGLSNIRERLTAMFDKRGQVIITPNTPCGTQVRIELPYTVSEFPTVKTK